MAKRPHRRRDKDGRRICDFCGWPYDRFLSECPLSGLETSWVLRESHIRLGYTALEEGMAIQFRAVGGERLTSHRVLVKEIVKDMLDEYTNSPALREMGFFFYVQAMLNGAIRK